MIIMGYSQVTGNKYVFAASMLPYVFIPYTDPWDAEAVRVESKHERQSSPHFFTVGWCLPIAFYLQTLHPVFRG
jgi:hypothetical protein